MKITKLKKIKVLLQTNTRDNIILKLLVCVYHKHFSYKLQMVLLRFFSALTSKDPRHHVTSSFYVNTSFQSQRKVHKFEVESHT